MSLYFIKCIDESWNFKKNVSRVLQRCHMVHYTLKVLTKSEITFQFFSLILSLNHLVLYKKMPCSYSEQTFNTIIRNDGV